MHIVGTLGTLGTPSTPLQSMELEKLQKLVIQISKTIKIALESISKVTNFHISDPFS